MPCWITSHSKNHKSRMAKSSNKEPLTPLSLSPKALQNERAPHLLSQRVGWKRLKYPYTRSYNSSPHRGILVTHMKFSIGRSRIHRAFASYQRTYLDHAACRPLRSFSARPDPVSACRAFGLGFVAQPSNPDSFVVNRCKPRRLSAASKPIPLMTWPPRRPSSVLVLWPNQQTVMLGFVEQPRNPAVFW
jgi:hypothetical protein